MKTKNKLMAAVAMLVISTLMLTTASYAWFTISTAPEVKGMTAKVVTNENLEIALAGSDTKVPGASTDEDKGKQTTWGNIIDLTSTDVKTAYDAVDKTLRPATYDTESKKFQYPVYSTDGRVEKLEVLTEEEGHPYGNLKNGTDIYGYYIDMWIRTNVAGDIALTEAVNRSGATTAEKGGGSVFTIKAAEGSTVDASALKTVAENMKVAARVLGSAAAGAESMTAATNDLVVFGVAAGTTDADKKLTCDKVFTATANTAYLVRVYVYLEGENVTNAAASIDNGEIIGEINIQFKNANVDNPMDKPATP